MPITPGSTPSTPASAQDGTSLYDNYRDLLLFIVCRKFGVADTDAEELLQDVFVAYLTTVVRIENPRAWLVAAACNASRAYLRVRSRQDQLDNVTMDEMIEAVTCDSDRLHRQITVARVLRLLPARDREVLRLRYFEALTVAEVAERFGTSPGYATRLIARAIARARMMYRENRERRFATFSATTKAG